MKFIKPHLGEDDIMAGDPPNEHNENTKINVDKKGPTGKSALEYQDKYGNHLPWFMIKQIVGDDVWNEYTKITIERNPLDRLVSLFCFLNPVLFSNVWTSKTSNYLREWYDNHAPGTFINEAKKHVLEKLKSAEFATQTIYSMFPEQVREYFQEMTLLQLNAKVLPLVNPGTYGQPGIKQENNALEKSCKQLKLKCHDFDREPVLWTANNGVEHGAFPYIKGSKWREIHGDDVIIELDWFTKRTRAWRMPSKGQCRFLNYGYYYDGKNIKVDHIASFSNVADSLGSIFESSNIDIKCNKALYDANSQNIHYRKKKDIRPVEWWYQGPNGKPLAEKIKNHFNFLECHCTF